MSEFARSDAPVTIVQDPRDRELLAQCAEVHIREIPDGFLPTFGKGFLTHLYDHIARSDRSFLLVALVDDQLHGFICGSYGAGSLYKSFLLRKHVRAVFPVAIRLFKRGVCRKVWEIIRYPAGEASGELPGSEILNFCVSRTCQGHGVGQRLFRALCAEYRRRGISRIRIVTGKEQRSAQRFYEQAGARKETMIQVHDRVESLVYVYDIVAEGDCA